MKTISFTKAQKEGLEKLGLSSAEEILNFFPYRYDFIKALPKSEWVIGGDVIVEGIIITKINIFRFKGNKDRETFQIQSDDDIYNITIFNRRFMTTSCKVGDTITIFGKFEGNNRITASKYNKIPLIDQEGFKPYYSLKDCLKDTSFTKIIDKLLSVNENECEDFLSKEILEKNNMLTKYEAYLNIHRPTNQALLAKAIYTFKFEEFLKFQLIMALRKKNNKIINFTSSKTFDKDKVTGFINDLPFKLTNDQLKAVEEILADLNKPYQMCRLLQGDVGCGKTVVAFIGMYACYLAGYQAALMAPTEILAKQHFTKIKDIFKNYDINIELLYSKQDTASKKRILKGLEDGSIDMVVGTHSLFQKDVNYANLGLIVTDEQHRFGVKQRQALQAKGLNPDVLLMSATPIPRTLANTLYGDMDVTTINETPNKDKVIHTELIKKNSFMAIVKQLEAKLDEGNQMYVVCAAIDSNEDPGIRNVNDIYNNLNVYFNGRYRLGLLHGKMSEEQKDEVENSFANGQIDILVTTTVIEVGVDVANANIMVIYDANRFGLSQLHQLRGRVGRGKKEGYCYLLTGSKDEEALARLDIIVKNTDGFKISYQDLKLRGPGDILGYRQSGLPTFVLGNVVNDVSIMTDAQTLAAQIINDINNPDYGNIRKYLQQIEKGESFFID